VHVRAGTAFILTRKLRQKRKACPAQSMGDRFGRLLQGMSVLGSGHDGRMPSVHFVWMDFDERAANVDFCLYHVGQFLRCLFFFLH